MGLRDYSFFLSRTDFDKNFYFNRKTQIPALSFKDQLSWKFEWICNFFHKIKYDLKCHFYVMEKFCDFLYLRSSDLITTLHDVRAYGCFNVRFMANYYLPLDDDYWIRIKEAVNNALCWLNYIKIGFIKPLLKSYDM